MQDFVTRIGTAAVRLPELGILASRDDGSGGAQGDGLVAVLRVVSAVAADAGNPLVDRNLVEQRWQDRRIANAVVSHYHGSDLQRRRVDPKVRLFSTIDKKRYR